MKNILTCNGMIELCDRRYDQAIYPTTHNSTAMEYGSGPNPVLLIPNQDRTIEEQLKDGVRGFMIDIWYYHEQVYTCHRFCELGGQPLLGIMQVFENFLKNNPNEVLTIIFENYVSGSDLNKTFSEAGLISYVHHQVQGETWPTLRKMIESNKRLVIFKEFEDEGPSWDMNVWNYAVETPYSYASMSEFTCDYNRGKIKNSLYILNQFITVAFSRKDANRKSNELKTLMNRAHLCLKKKKKIPNFITVDFYSSGDLIAAVHQLNVEFNNFSKYTTSASE